jgi:hypothetical protein
MPTIPRPPRHPPASIPSANALLLISTPLRSLHRIYGSGVNSLWGSNAGRHVHLTYFWSEPQRKAEKSTWFTGLRSGLIQPQLLRSQPQMGKFTALSTQLTVTDRRLHHVSKSQTFRCQLQPTFTNLKMETTVCLKMLVPIYQINLLKPSANFTYHQV